MKKSCIRETPNRSTDANRSTDTEKNKQGFFFFFRRFGGGGLLCPLQQSPGLHFYPLNYTALLFYAVHFIEKLKKYM